MSHLLTALAQAVEQVNERKNEVEKHLHITEGPRLPPLQFIVDALVVAVVAWFVAMLASLTSVAIVIVPGIVVCGLSTMVLSLVVPIKSSTTIAPRVVIAALQVVLQLFVLATTVSVVHAFTAAAYRRHSTPEDQNTYSHMQLRHLERYSAAAYYTLAACTVVVLLWQCVLLLACECAKPVVR